MKKSYSHRYAIVVAGGSGTRLWPLSRQDLPKQMQKFVSDRTLIDETVQRLVGLVPIENIYVSTTSNYIEKMRELLPEVLEENFILEPVTRGTTAAFALFTAKIYKRDAQAVIFTLASDHAVTDIDRFHTTLDDAYAFIEAHPEYIELVGIKPTKPDSGLGYIKIDQVINETPLVHSVEKFIEKPSVEVATTYLQTDEYLWNAAYYCYKATTLMAAYDDADPNIFKYVQAYLASGKNSDFDKVPIKAQEIEFIDTKKFPLAIISADFEWSDIGNWQSLYALLSGIEQGGVVKLGNQQHLDIDSNGCLVYSTDSRLVATVGLENIVIVSTDDTLLVLNKDKSQDIKKVLAQLKEKGLTDYL